MTNGGHQTAASLLEAGTWQWHGKNLQVQAAASKVMLEMAYNPEAQRIARECFRRAVPAGYNLSVTPEPRGDASSSTTQHKTTQPRAIPSSTPQTMDHPLVQRAQELFQAEIRSVVDLRKEN